MNQTNDGARLSLKSETTDRRNLVDAYLQLTKEVLPSLAQSGGRDWPVRQDHCFQRIVLDTICGGVWYAYLDRPAYKNLTHEQARRAVDLCREIAEGRADLQQLNNQSLIWRGKSRVRLEQPFGKVFECQNEHRYRIQSELRLQTISTTWFRTSVGGGVPRRQRHTAGNVDI